MKIAVVGLGYVGLPTALLFAKSGFQVIGFDTDSQKLKTLKIGKLPFGENEPGLFDLFLSVKRRKNQFHVTDDRSSLADSDVFLIAVDTPIDQKTKKPTYTSLKSALETVGQVMKVGVNIIVESTIAPLTMEKVVIPALEQSSKRKIGQDFSVLHCPERITPGKTLHNLMYLDRVIGAATEREGRIGKKLYQSFCKGRIDIVSFRTAEVVKTAENAQRDVEIAFANELAQVCDAYDVDFSSVRELIERMPNRSLLNPGAGVGGHCLPKDSWLLRANLPTPVEPSLITTARSMNDAMPSYISALLKDAFRSIHQTVRGKKIAVLGYAYREDTDDSRMSPTETLHKLLKRNGATVSIHDPYVKGFERDLHRVLKGAHAVISMVGHSVYKQPSVLRQMKTLMRGNVLIDGRHVFSRTKAEKLGFIFRGIGQHE